MTNTIYQKPFCTYLTVIIHEDLPFMYIGKGKTKDVIEGRYKGSVSSKKYRDIFNRLKKEQPHLIQSEVINQFETNEEAIAEEIKLHKLYDVKNCPVFMNKANQTTVGCAFTNGLLGENNGMYGKQHSEESKIQMSEKAKVRTKEKNSMYGKQHSEESKIQMSAKKKGRTKETCLGVAQGAKKRTGRTKETCLGIARQAAKIGIIHKGKTKDTDAGVAKQVETILSKAEIFCPHCGKGFKYEKRLDNHIKVCANK
jgi:hypothetical protein